MSLPSQRLSFEIPAEVAYLNCAFLSPNHRRVRQAGEEAVRRTSRPWEISAPDFFRDGEELRTRFAELVEGDPDGVAIVPSASYGIGVAAANLVAEGDRVVVLAEQFPSNVYPWRESGAELVTVPHPDEGTWTAPVLEAIDERTAVVAIPNCHWTDGRSVDLERVSERAREVGAALVVDATQSLGALPLSVAGVQPDFLVAAAYKWLLGPYGMAFLYAAPGRREGRPLEFNWINRRESEQFARLVDYRDDYQPGARRYDVGERSNFILVPMALAALRTLLAWGVGQVEETIRGLTDRVEQGAAGLGLSPVPAEHRGPHMLGVRIPGGPPSDLADRLADRGIQVSLRGDSVRVSPHVYNGPEDVDRLLEVLAGQ